MYAPRLFESALACALALLPGLACNSGNAAATTTAKFDQAAAWKHLEAIVSYGDRAIGRAGLAPTRAYIQGQLERIGYQVINEEFTERTPAHSTGRVEFVNLYADLAGESAPGTEAKLVIIGAHFDGKDFDVPGAPDGEGFQGANDGASGTAVLLELARVLFETGPHKVTYRFLFLDGEEATLWNWAGSDNTYGSRRHVINMIREYKSQGRKFKEHCAAFILLDMVGDKDLKLNEESHSDQGLLKIFFDAARANGLGKHVGGPRKAIEDDHKSFLDRKIPAVDLIDFSYGPGNRYWHTSRDRVENCSAKSLGVIGKIVLFGLPKVEERALRMP